MTGDKCIPSIGEYIYLARASEDRKTPYIVIDANNESIALQRCKVIDRSKIAADDSGEIKILS